MLFFLVLLALGLTGLGIRSAFIIVISVIFYTLTTYINCFTKLQLRDSVWIIVNAIGQFIPFMFYSYYTIIVLDMFIPIQARSGASDNPDDMVGYIVIGFGLLMGGLLVPTLYMFKRSFFVLLAFLVVFIAFGIAMATPIGFPYRHAISPKRYWIFHTQRTFHNFDGSVTERDSGYYMRGMDRHYDDYIADYVPHMQFAEKASSLCEREMMCGLPSYQAIATSISSEYSHWLPSSSPNLPFETRLTLLSQTNPSSPNITRFAFELRGPDHMALSISPLPGNNLVSWSFLDTPPLARYWGTRKLYAMMLMYGLDTTGSPISFYLDIEKSTTGEPCFDIAVVSHFTHHKEDDTADYTEFLEYFPDWAHVTSWTSAYERWTH